MPFHNDSKFPTRRAYVLKLHHDATRSELSGRIENVVTCRQGDFTSANELVELIASDLEALADAPEPR